MKIKSLFLSAFLSIAVLVFAQTPAQTIPDFTFFKLDKTAFTNAALAKDKMLFFFFFDPDCDHCQRAATNLNKQFSDYKKTAIYLISESDKDKITRFINQYLPALNNKQNVTILQDTKNEFLTKFQPIRYPAMFLYTPAKKLADYEDNAESMFRFLKSLQAAK